MIFCNSEVEKNLPLRLHIIGGDVELCDPQLRQDFPNRPNTCGDECHEKATVTFDSVHHRGGHRRLPKWTTMVVALPVFFWLPWRPL